MDALSTECPWMHRQQLPEMAPRSMLVQWGGIDYLEQQQHHHHHHQHQQQLQYHNSKMSAMETSGNMFMRSGNGLPAATTEGPQHFKPLPWGGGQSMMHHSGCDFVVSEGNNAMRGLTADSRSHLQSHTEGWGPEGMDCNLRGNPNLKSAFRSNVLPTHMHRECFNQSEISPQFYTMPQCPSNLGANGLHSLAEGGSKALHFLGSISTNVDGRHPCIQQGPEVEKSKTQSIQDLIHALQTGGSRSKMEAAITVRSLAASHNLHQVALIAAGGICPLVELLSYEAGETHWPPEMREKAMITVRAEAALALASLSVSNDDNKSAIGAAGAIPLLCDLIQFDEESYNPAVASYHKQEMAPFLVLARDAGVGALSCLSKNEKNKEAILAAQAVPVLVHMVDHGTSFGRAAAANVLAKLTTGDNVQNKVVVGKEGAIPALLRLIKHGSPKARETAAEALANLALYDWNKAKIIQEGGIDCLSKMVEGGALQPEKDAAAAALNVLKGSLESPSKPQNGTDEKSLSSADTKQETSEERQQPKPDDETPGLKARQPKRVAAGEEHLQSSIVKGFANSQSHDSMSVLRTNFSGINPLLPAMQTIVTSELTSSLAPPLVGQPSIQADAVPGSCPKGVSPVMPGRKRLKMTLPDMDARSAQLTKEPGNQTCFHTNVEPMSYSVDKRGSAPGSWLRYRGGQHQAHQSFHPTGYSHQDRQNMRDQSRQCAEGDQPAAGGILALVDALSSLNPGAQEFSALALMLLASQGGFEVKTAIADAGALPPLVAMVDNSTSPMIRESAAAAIAKLVSCHPVNRAAVVRCGGVRAMVNMAKWSATFVNGPASGGSLGARTQAAAIVAVLNISEVLDRQSMGMGLKDALPILGHMLESENLEEIGAGVGGLQALGLSLGIEPDITLTEDGDQAQYEWPKPRKFEVVAVEMITALLDLGRGSSEEAKLAAFRALAGFRQPGRPDTASITVADASLSTGEKQPMTRMRKEGVQALFTLLERGPSTAGFREIIIGAFAGVVASEKLNIYIEEFGAVQQLMRLLQEGPTIATRVFAAATVANMGAKKKRLDAISSDHILLLLQLLASDVEVTEPNVNSGRPNSVSYGAMFPHPDSQLHSTGHCPANSMQNQYVMPYNLLREHAAAILVYTALSGEKKKQAIIAAGAAPVLVRVLQGCLSFTENCVIPSAHSDFLHPFSNARPIVAPVFPQATQEFAMMGLILLADKSTETMEKIVDAGGIPILVKMLAATGGRGKLGASWSEMAAAALLSLAGCDNAREEIIRVGGIASLVQVLKGEGGASAFSLTGLAAMAQLLGVLALNNQEAKLHMAKAGAVRCLVDILVGGGCLAWAAEGEGRTREGPGLVALAQEAAAAALATVVLHCPGNAEAAVEAGVIGPLVRLLGSPIPASKVVGASGSPDSGASSAETGVTHDSNSRTTDVTGEGGPGAGPETVENCATDGEGGSGGTRIGGSLAAMAALGNLVSCFPQCRHEIVDAGGIIRLANLLQDQASPKVKGESPPVSGVVQVPDMAACQIKLHESAALVLGLLTEGEIGEAQEPIGFPTDEIKSLRDPSTTPKGSLSLATAQADEMNTDQDCDNKRQEPAQYHMQEQEAKDQLVE